MIHAGKRVNPIHFGSDPADIRNRTRINPESRIWIAAQILALAEFALSECCCLMWLYVMVCLYIC